MPLNAVSTLPPGMRERTFALKSYPSGEVINFGRGTDFPASSYTFPSIEANSESYRRMGSHSTSYGSTSLTPDFFEAEIGAVEPRAADKLDRLARAWNAPNFKRVSGERHELYYVLGGRARIMYGKPSRIGFVHHGYKTSYHEAVLRFAVSDPFFYSAEEAVLSGSAGIAPNTTSTFTTGISEIPSTEIPTPASITVTGSAKKITVRSGSRILLAVNDLNGTFTLDNLPGFSKTRYTPSGQPANTGADLIGVETPAFSECSILPGQSNISVDLVGGATPPTVTYTVKWRSAYASP